MIAISTKGHIAEPAEYKILCASVKHIISRLRLKVIIIYDVCGNLAKTLKAFEPAIQAGIKIIIPDNNLKARNEARWEARHETR